MHNSSLHQETDQSQSSSTSLIERHPAGEYPLAVFAHNIGSQSHTYIWRHMNLLVPKRTVVVAETMNKLERQPWSVEGPQLILDQVKFVDPLLIISRRINRPLARSVVKHLVRRFLKKNKVRVVLGEFMDRSLLASEVARELGIPFFVHAHGFDVSARLREPEWRLKYRTYGDAEGIITINEISRRRLIELGLNGERIHVIPCGVEIPHIPTQRPVSDIVTCLAVGRMITKKAPILALDAFRRALESIPTLRLEMVGNGPLLPAVIQYVRAFGLEEHVTVHASQPPDVVQDLMKRADIFLQHSITDPDTGDEEGLPVAILEAMSHGLPVVSTIHGGIHEAVVDGVTGLLVEEGQNHEMSRNIIALASDAATRHAMGVAGRERARAQYSWEKERAELLSLFRIDGQPTQRAVSRAA